MNIQLTHKSKNHNDINLVALNVLGSWATTENYTTESEEQYFLICHKFNNERRVLLENISNKLFPNLT